MTILFLALLANRRVKQQSATFPPRPAPPPPPPPPPSPPSTLPPTSVQTSTVLHLPPTDHRRGLWNQITASDRRPGMLLLQRWVARFDAFYVPRPVCKDAYGFPVSLDMPRDRFVLGSTKDNFVFTTVTAVALCGGMLVLAAK